ncbi:hypothetical protein P691DRAFT_256115 [Macrolepiota fuliginosa MF-IS2]|uniref:Uncharacterized protein n=1 Tax=Macrolepiota fuliginosa MF-IS2 TaxID=1400762 RepID=A0A9P5X6Y2_9AGAR|nr:hypothetical protein P691DRAFT_256115 [Macrolepiota fuliginosa MF-IS2]
MELLHLFIAVTYLTTASAKNSLKLPCLNGECWYDIPSRTPNSFGGTLVITGPRDAISDVTSAAGWTILDCDKNLSVQKFRAVCADEEDTDKCNHLFVNGAKNKIIRLPDNCGPAPFARVAQIGISSDQSIPSDLAARAARRDESSPTVHDISVDNNFGAANSAQRGEVAFAVVGANERGFPAGSMIRNLAAIRRSRIARGEDISFVDQAFDSWKDWKKSGSKTFPLLNVDKTFTLFDESISCPLNNGSGLSFSAKVKADLHGTAMKDFALFGNWDATVDGKFELIGSASTTLDSGVLTFLEVPIAGLDIPDILSIGPVFKLQGEAKATLDVTAQMSVDLSYSARSAAVYWPPSGAHASTGLFTPISNGLKLSIPPLYTSRASIEAHLIPRLEFKISAFKDRVKSTIYILLDASVTTALTLSPDTLQSPSGCIDVVAGLDVHGGAEADFFGLFDGSTVLPIYKTTYDVYKKCFNRPTAQATKLMERNRALTCPSGQAAVLVSVTDL